MARRHQLRSCCETLKNHWCVNTAGSTIKFTLKEKYEAQAQRILGLRTGNCEIPKKGAT
ncbi:hypothetical protein K0M31_005548 [Melipona bicolor]|uniref:Uncharacterized protein n=1 Tax=Melipona bicolor TaxID=60889 RepID=A0AA40KMM5_9HYME|nr:hypothetical protein K0M31_005548 [Melipona bicolor]